jgi:peptide/nickel transport system substrate-binding protein
MTREWTSPKGFPSFWFKPADRPTSFKAIDKWTVEIKVPPTMQGALFMLLADQTHIYAPEVVDKYGDYTDWRNQAGTGPFILTDYVPGMALTFARNPNYWYKDPLHPQNQLPYVDSLKQLIIPDLSTQLAAFRTAKLDYMGMSPAVSWEDQASLMKFAPQLKYQVIAGADIQIWWRIDKQELPFKDVRVRQALNLAVNKQEVADKYYQGHADLLGHPYPPFKAWEPMYTPLNQMPANVQELVKGGNPEKAKKLLADAGYPNGFKTQIAVETGPNVDFLAIIKEYLLKVGVDMDIKPLETGVFAGVNRMRTYEQMIYVGSPTAAFPYTMPSMISETLDDKSYYENPKTRAVFNEVNKYVGRDDANDAKWMKLLKDITPFYLEESVGLWLPTGQVYRMWWPWVKNYRGEGPLGYDNQMAFTRYIWIDQSVKK